MAILQLTQDDMDDQNKDYHEDYLHKASVGDWVYDDGEVLCSQSCIEDWHRISTTDEEIKKWSSIYDRLKSLNNK